ncbi:MAG: hypothetical protein K6E88_09685 [Lachnospiraceae bacterium]|nr:hypothetical protein [Lachnospiraceae bacterium]
MRKITKLFVVTAALTLLCAVPAMAQEVTDPKTIVTEQQFMKQIADHQAVVQTQVNSVVNSMADKNAAARQAAIAANDLKKYNRAEADNYLTYLNKAIVNLKETERIKKEVVDNYTNLAKVNPTYAAMLPQAVNDYNAAVAARQMWEANLAKATADFSAAYPR